MKQSKLFIKKLNKILINNYNKYFIENEILLNNAKYIDEFDDYVIFKDGRIFTFKSNHTSRFLTPHKSSKYIDYILYKNDKPHTRCLHKLLAIAFIENPKPDEYDEVDHININELDNRLENLRWCNKSINGRNKNIQKNNKTGVQGVRYRKDKNQYIAKYVDNNGKRCEKSFSLNKYENAKELAIEYRQKMVDKYYNRKIA